MKKLVYFLMFCLAFNLSFSIGYIDDANKLNDLTNMIVGKLNKSEWEVSLKAARKIYYWTKNNIQYDYEKDKEILEGKNFSIKSPYQTFLTRKGNSYEIALLDLVLLYNTGLYTNEILPDYDSFIRGIPLDEYLLGFKCPDWTPKPTICDAISKYHIHGFLDEFIKQYKDVINKINLSNYYYSINMKKPEKKYLIEKAERLKKYIPFEPKRNLYLIVVDMSNKEFPYQFDWYSKSYRLFKNRIENVSVAVGFDVYLKPYCSFDRGVIHVNNDTTYDKEYFIGCGMSKTLYIIDTKYGIFTLPDYMKFLIKKYNKKYISFVLYQFDTNNDFKKIYLINAKYPYYDVQFVDYKYVYNNFDKLYDLFYKIEITYCAGNNIWDMLGLLYIEKTDLQKVINTFKYYPAPYNEINYSG